MPIVCGWFKPSTSGRLLPRDPNQDKFEVDLDPAFVKPGRLSSGISHVSCAAVSP